MELSIRLTKILKDGDIEISELEDFVAEKGILLNELLDRYGECQVKVEEKGN